MSQNINILATINAVEGFNPEDYAVDYTDLNTKETRKRLPVIAQIAWFRLKYPLGKIALKIEQRGNLFVATARIHPDYKDPVDAYLSEATASRAKCDDIPSVSPREWAQTAAIGIALRNAGFGLQFSMAGESFSANAPDEFALDVGGGAATIGNESDGSEAGKPSAAAVAPAATPIEAPPKELTAEEKFQLACKVPCTLKKYEGRTLGDIMLLDRNFLVYIATKYEGNEKLKEAAKTICEYAASNAA